jgi:lysophospholipid acyltransferase (LPLAT)-like uncharacterized protein
LWHENLLVPAYLFARCRIAVLISQHRDGELITQVARRLGFEVARGSATRGGASGVRQLLQLARRWHLAITPDGPRGPRRQLKEGVLHLARWSGLPVVPVGFAYQRPWRTRSWDRLVIPRPGTTLAVYGGLPIQIDGRCRLEESHWQLRAAMEAAESAAQQVLASDWVCPPTGGVGRDSLNAAA